MTEEFSLCRLADEAGISEFHFNRLFKQATGVPPSQYLLNLRVNEARRLLTETDQSVSEWGSLWAIRIRATSPRFSKSRPD